MILNYLDKHEIICFSGEPRYNHVWLDNPEMDYHDTGGSQHEI